MAESTYRIMRPQLCISSFTTFQSICIKVWLANSPSSSVWMLDRDLGLHYREWNKVVGHEPGDKQGSLVIISLGMHILVAKRMISWVKRRGDFMESSPTPGHIYVPRWILAAALRVRADICLTLSDMLHFHEQVAGLPVISSILCFSLACFPLA